jgi:type III secretion protein L
MTRLIKKNPTDTETDTQRPSLSSPEHAVRKSPVIDKETFEARNESHAIRERAKAQAEHIVSEAEAEAKRVLLAAQEQAEQIKQEAHAQGLEEGKTEGATALAETVAQASARMAHIEAQVVPQLKDLAVAIAKRILGKELSMHPEQVVAIVRQALAEKARQRTEIFLRVHPEDLALLRTEKHALLEVLSRAKEIGLREDPNVQRYGVVIETDAGTIDAQLETQLAVFERVLKDVP